MDRAIVTIGDQDLLIICLDDANDEQVDQFRGRLSEVLPEGGIDPIILNFLVDVTTMEIGGKSITFVTGEDMGDDVVAEFQRNIDERLPEGSNPVIVGNIPINTIKFPCKEVMP
ncbi:MAG: hypothetical protein WCO84_08505 [bacterium]